MQFTWKLNLTTWQAASASSRLLTGLIEKEELWSQSCIYCHDAGGGARDVAGRGTPARNAIGPGTWAEPGRAVFVQG